MSEKGVEIEDIMPNELISPENQLKFLKRIYQNNTPVYLIGGVAVDILLEGGITRPHKDIDMFALNKDKEEIRQKFEQAGYLIEEVNDNTHKLKAKSEDIDTSIALLNETGQGAAINFTAPSGQEYRAVYDPELFSKPPIEIGGIQVKTVSPLGLIQTINTFDTFRPKDLETQKALQEKFFPNESPNAIKFKPQVQEIVLNK